MLTVETIRKIRLAAQGGKPIRQIARDIHVSRNTVRKVLRNDVTEFVYDRQHQPRPKLGLYVKILEDLLEADETLVRKRRRSSQVLFELLQAHGYEGGYDSVRRYVKAWRVRKRQLSAPVYIPLVFQPGEAFQFDWSEDWANIGGERVKLQVAHIKLSHSRAFLVRAYPLQTHEMLFDAHWHAFRVFGGVPGRGIYDNMKTAVDRVGKGKQRDINARFKAMASHYVFEPECRNCFAVSSKSSYRIPVE